MAEQLPHLVGKLGTPRKQRFTVRPLDGPRRLEECTHALPSFRIHWELPR